MSGWTLELELDSRLYGRTSLICAADGVGPAIALHFRGTGLALRLTEKQANVIAEWFGTEYGEMGFSQILSMPGAGTEVTTLTLRRRPDGLDLALSAWRPEAALNPRAHREVLLDPRESNRFAEWLRWASTRTDVTR